jgi:hypothetical protein
MNLLENIDKNLPKHLAITGWQWTLGKQQGP